MTVECVTRMFNIQKEKFFTYPHFDTLVHLSFTGDTKRGSLDGTVPNAHHRFLSLIAHKLVVQQMVGRLLVFFDYTEVYCCILKSTNYCIAV